MTGMDVTGVEWLILGLPLALLLAFWLNSL